ncbi:MAG: carboxypeptidase regulatory-like domain-containing protein [Bacteroidia bacterium]
MSLMRYLIVYVGLGVSLLYAQQDAAKIRGVVRDKATNEPLPFATVVLLQGGAVKAGTNSNDQGEYSIGPVAPGKYDLRVSYSGQTVTITGVVLYPNKTSVVDVTMKSDVELEKVEVVEYKVPLFQKDETVTGKTITLEDIQKLGTRNVNTMLATTAGVFQADDGGSINVRGARADATQYFVDGVRVIGQLAMSQRAIGQLTVYTGGVPAEFGDLMGGVVQITTGAPSSTHTLGGEIQSSQFTDPYKFNLFALNANGPILSKISDEALGLKRTILGYFVAGEYQHERDYDPPYGGTFRVKPEILQDLRERPLQPNATGTFFINRASFLTANDLENIPYRENNWLSTYRLNGRLDFQLSENTILKLGASYQDLTRKGWSITQSLLATDEIGEVRNQTLRGFARIQQNIIGDTNSLLSNIFYTLQVDYTYNLNRNQDPRLPDIKSKLSEVFRYGYVGRFDQERVPLMIPSGGVYTMAGFADYRYTFDPTNTSYPILANYNRVIYDYLAANPRILFDPITLSPQPFDGVRNYLDLVQLGGNTNGLISAQTLLYNLFVGQGYPAVFAPALSQGDVFRVTGQAGAEIGRHNLKIGFEFDQRNERYYQVSMIGGTGIWQLMRQYANKHLEDLDLDNPIYGTYMGSPAIYYRPLYKASDQSEFDKNLRAKLGLPIDGTDYIVTDAVDPSLLSLDMFSVQELWAGGSLPVIYQGYTAYGKRARRVAPEKFFTDTKNRPQNPFSPTYIGLYAQDKFEFDKLFFNLGVRVDRYDANLPVPKDPFVLREHYTAGETARILGVSLPAGVGQDWVAYVDNALNPSRIIGYRQGVTWYDANGAPTSALGIIRLSGGRALPHIKVDSLTYGAFEDYKPQINIMPRISFSFPISDLATFFAHYDVLTQRPRARQVAQFVDYYFIVQNSTISIDNPRMRPEKTIDFEVGFKQLLTQNIALSISGYYREQRNMVQTTRFLGAYPVSYESFDNLDFSTVKGINIDLDVRRAPGNILQLRFAYTLQYAQGTGSSFSSNRGVLGGLEGFTVFRSLLPLSFDQRHTFNGTADLRFVGANQGPSLNLGGKTIYPLKNAGINITYVLYSGRPYTRYLFPNPADVQFGVNPVNQISGQPLSNNLPWYSRFDVRIDRDFFISRGEGKQPAVINVYVIFLNVLNTRNILGVYPYTGLPDDSGYIQSPIGQQIVASQFSPESFALLYKIKEKNPGLLSSPLRIRIGTLFTF